MKHPAPMRLQTTRAGLRTAFTNLTLAALFLLFSYAQLRKFLEHPRVSLLLIVVLETIFAVFFVIRRPAASTSMSFTAWASTTLGTLLPLLLRPAADAEDFLAAQAVQVAGSVLGILGVLSLNRSLGLLPANRGIRGNGAYRIVRHPLYAAYTVTHLGYIASNFTGWNIAVAVCSLGSQLVRIHSEEQLLSLDPAYLDYKARTRWRLVPFLY